MPTVTLRPYQDRGVEAIREAFRQGKRAPLFVLPTGGGKTVTFSYIASEAAKRGKRLWICVHRAELLKQVRQSLDRFECPHGVIAAGHPMNQSEQVHVCGIATLVKRLDRVAPPDIIILDEAHHSAAASWSTVIKRFPTAKLLGVTATPCRLDGKGLGDYFDALIQGPTTLQLIRDGFLSPPAYFAPPQLFDETVMRTTAGDFNRHDAAVALDKPTITGDAVKHYLRICPGVPALAFCVSVEHAEHVAETFRASGIRAASIDGSLPDDERADRVASLADGRLQVLTSCDLISEGFDVPTVTAAILLRPTQSLSLHLQQIGRALRISPGKQRAYIIDHVGNLRRHGLAEDEREWELGGTVMKKKRQLDGDAGLRLAQCPLCFSVHAPAPACPCCGHIYAGKDRTPEQVDGELIALPSLFGDEANGAPTLSGGQFMQCPACASVHADALERCPKCGRDHRAADARAAKREQGAAQTLADLIAIGRKRGIKQPHLWAAHIIRARDAKRAKQPQPFSA